MSQRTCEPHDCKTGFSPLFYYLWKIIYAWGIPEVKMTIPWFSIRVKMSVNVSE